MSGAEAVLAIQLVVAAIAIAGSVASAVIARRQIGNAVPDPDLKKHPTADEGSAAAWLFGGLTRVSGQLIYLAETRPIPVPGEEKGKSPQVVAWNYETDVAIAWCRNVCDEDPITRIWASGELIFARVATLDIALPETVERADPAFWGPFDHWNIPNGTTVDDTYCYPERRPRERRFAVGGILYVTTDNSSVAHSQMNLVLGRMLNVEVTVSGSVIGNNGVYKCTYWEKYDHPTDGSKTQWTIKLFRGNITYPNILDVLATPEQICQPISSPPLFFPDTESTLVLSFTVEGVSQYIPPAGMITYRGTDTQNPNLVLQSVFGPENTPAFRGTCYTMIAGLDITKWAATIPHFEAEVRVHQTQQFARDAFNAVLARNEAARSYNVDTSLIPSSYQPVFGLAVMGPTTPATTLKMLMQVHDIEAQERLQQVGVNLIPEPVMFFVPREELPVEVIDYDQTSAREAGDDGTVHATVKRATRDELPQEFIVEFTEIERDLQPGSMSYSVATGGVRNTQKLSLPLTYNQPSADVLVKRLLWKAINFHDKVEFMLPPTHYGITEGDRLQLDAPSDGLPIICRVAQITVGENGLLEVKADIDDDLAYVQYENGGYSGPDDTQVQLPLNAMPLIVDMAPISAAHATQFGLYLANTAPSIDGSITYSYYYSLDQVNWSPPVVIQNAATFGEAETELMPPDEVHAWDMFNTVTVRISSRTQLESVTQEEVELGMNWARIGSEVIGFMDATVTADPDPLVGGTVYILSGLLRGRNDTEADAAAGQPIGARFVMLPPTSQALAFVPLEPTLYRLNLYFAIAPAGAGITDGVIVQVPPNAETLRPYSVHATWGIKRPNGDICVYATPRTRVPYRLLSELIAPFVEEGPASDYQAHVYWLQGSTWVYARTIFACDSKHPGQLAFDYNATLQDEDLNQTGLLPPGPYTTLPFLFEISRISDTIGDGRIVEFCIEDVGVEYNGVCLPPPQ